MNCPVCSSPENSLYSKDKARDYFLCQNCSLVFVPRTSLITPEKELARYDTHNNDDKDEKYRQYLSGVVKEIIPFTKPQDIGLDFGSGKTNVLAQLMTEAGVSTEIYDLYYHPHEEIWSKQFDVIILSEVIEHLRDPMETMKKLCTILRPGGRFFIKTKLRPDSKESFDRWYYKNDPTHVEFFAPESFEKMCRLLNMNRPEFLGQDVVMVRASR